MSSWLANVIASHRVIGEAPYGRQEATMKRLVGALALTLSATASFAQQMPIPYGQSVTLEAAKKIALPALAEAQKNSWTMAVAIVDASGDLVYFEKMDNT